MGVIVKLDEKISNMIAAGEVVLRPLSVVKELVENSIDAKANNITINLVNCGMNEIEVIDDGAGMDKDDVLLSFTRHATSKIKNQNDLYRIKTLGFRGEAIPSIASVSDMTIKSAKNDVGYLVNYRGGKKINDEYTSLNQGTIVSVKSLFFNTPARLKYIKSLSVELGLISDFVSKIALANPNIRFKLTNDKKVLIQSNGYNDIVSLIGNIYGSSISKEINQFEATGNGVAVSGYLINPYINKSRKTYITIVVNGRVVKNNSILNAVISGYDTLLPIGRYPISVINIEIDSMLIDVNVHPSKDEIKFSSEDELVELIKNGIKDALNKKTSIPSVKPIKESYRPMELDLSKKSDLSFDDIKKLYTSDEMDFVKEEPIINIYNEPNNFKTFKENETTNNVVESINVIKSDNDKLPYLEYIGHFRGTYLLFQNEEGLFLIDQHAAAERIRYEYYYKKLGNINSEAQQLLIPFNIELLPKDYFFVLEHLNELSDIGFVLEESGINSFYVRAIPTWAIDHEEELGEKILNYLIERKTIDLSKIRDSLAKSIACKTSIKANHKLNMDEINKLVENLRKCDIPYTCPHGRPTLIKITNYDIEKMFKRVM